MRQVDPTFPVFVLLGLLVGETYYERTLVPRLKALKLKYVGTSDAILHSRDIRRCDGAFQFLRKTDEVKREFHEAIGEIFVTSRIRLFAIVIDKTLLRARFSRALFAAPLNPYDISLSQLMSVICGPPHTPGPFRPTIAKIVAESRGRREDRELQSEYQSLRQRGLWNYGADDVQNRRSTTVNRLFPARVNFLKKSVGVAGLELADLAAYPIARASINRDWENPAFKYVQRKLKEMIHFP